MPTVTVIIPSYNRRDVIGRAISSVDSQTFTDFELIVVDDGSTDGTAECFSALDRPHLTFISHKRNRGAAAARNTGVLAARAPLVAFLDSDDEWLPDKLARQVRLLEQTKAAACCSGFLLHRNGAFIDRTLSDTRDWRARLLRGCAISPGSTLLVYRSCFEEIGRFNEDLGRFEDWEWLLRFVTRYELAAVCEPLSIVHANQWPSVTSVSSALDRLRRCVREMPGLASEERDVVLSAIEFEFAVALWRNGVYLGGIGRLLRHGFRSPHLTARFFFDVQRRRWPASRELPKWCGRD